MISGGSPEICFLIKFHPNRWATYVRSAGDNQKIELGKYDIAM